MTPTFTFDAVVSVPFGAVGIRTEEDFLIGLRMTTENLDGFTADDAFVQYVVSRIKQYFRDPGTTLDIPLAIRGTPYQKRVWQEMARIPAGEVVTYGELAVRVGSGARAVANVCGANHIPLVIPCHRVVAKNGLGGFMRGDKQGLNIKRWLLQHEAGARW